MWVSMWLILAGVQPPDIDGHYATAQGELEVQLEEGHQIRFSVTAVKEVGQTVHLCDLQNKRAPFSNGKAEYKFFPTQDYFSTCHLTMTFYPSGVQVRQLAGTCDCGQGVKLDGYYRKVRHVPGQ